MGLHKDLIGDDLHVNKLHAATHRPGGSDQIDYTHNVKGYGAVGDGVADDTVAIQAAIDSAAAAGGGTVFFPTGHYRTTAALVVKNQVNLVGAAAGYGVRTSHISQATVGAHVFTVGEGVFDMKFSNLYITSGAVLGAVQAGSHGVHFEGSYPNSSGRIGFENCFFRGLDYGIYALATDVAGIWQIDGVQLDLCMFYENNHSCYFKSGNANFWQFNSCRFAANVSCVEIAYGGHFTFINCTAGGSFATTIFINVTGVCEGLVLINCQAESLLEWLDVQASAPANYSGQYILQGCTINAPIYFRAMCQVISIGSLYSASVYAPATDVKIFSIGDFFMDAAEFLPAGSSPGIASQVVFMANFSQGLSLGTSTPDANALLDLVSTTKAFLPPRMTTAQRNAIASPTEGMVIWNTTDHVLNCYYTSWVAV